MFNLIFSLFLSILQRSSRCFLCPSGSVILVGIMIILHVSRSLSQAQGIPVLSPMSPAASVHSCSDQ